MLTQNVEMCHHKDGDWIVLFSSGSETELAAVDYCRSGLNYGDIRFRPEVQLFSNYLDYLIVLLFLVCGIFCYMLLRLLKIQNIIQPMFSHSCCVVLITSPMFDSILTLKRCRVVTLVTFN